MAKEFANMGDFAAHLLTLQAGELIALEAGLEHVLVHMERVAKDELGHYQPAVGPFPAWAELAESTKESKLSRGYDPDEPLLNEGDLRNSISHEHRGLEGAMGSTSQIMVYHEFGTAKMPARPVIGPAAFRSHEKIVKIIGSAMLVGLVSGRRIVPDEIEDLPRSLGYDASL